MGEMADFTNDGAHWLDWDEKNEFHFGKHEDGDGPPLYSITCRCCRKHGLSWGKVGSKFRLFENNQIHVCPVNPLER